jgi:hypothetical protein
MYFLPEKRIFKIIKTFLKKIKKSVDKSSFLPYNKSC